MQRERETDRQTKFLKFEFENEIEGHDDLR